MEIDCKTLRYMNMREGVEAHKGVMQGVQDAYEEQKDCKGTDCPDSSG